QESHRTDARRRSATLCERESSGRRTLEAVRRALGFIPAPFRRARSALRLRHFGRPCRSPRKEGLQCRSPQDSAARAAENDRRVCRSGEAAQRRHGAFEGRDRERGGGVIAVFVLCGVSLWNSVSSVVLVFAKPNHRGTISRFTATNS